jgi:hypothetical protein
MIRSARCSRVFSSLLLGALATSGASRAATVTQPETPESGESESPTMALPPDEPPTWGVGWSAYVYVTPDDTYFQPTVTADYGWLHLEARYNYEDRKTASTWVGFNLSTGQSVTFKITPMLGGVLGATNGLAVGCRGRLTWGLLELYTEGESVFAIGDSSSSFLYSWSSVTASPTNWLHLGVVAQRTRAYRTELGIQRGFLAGLSAGNVAITAFLFNPDLATPTYVFALDLSW